MSELEMFLTKLRDNKPFLQEQYGVNTLGVFGSFVRGDQDKNSDVDILVGFNETIGLLKFVALKYQLSELIGKDVDLVMKTALKPKIGERILKEVVYI
ncbi:MAG: nucleotidyltransferase family protein [Clostridia bacterium]|nr:nucleotidyltransferase family protein [Clostridia bacterium]